MAATTIEGKPTFPDVTVKRICSHMNDDHAVSVFAMAKRVYKPSGGGGWKISSAKMSNVTLEGCQLQVTLCKKTLCRQENLFYKFDPPVSNPAHVESKLIAVQHRVCRPVYSKLSFIFVALNLVFLTFLMGYFGRAGLVAFIEPRQQLRYWVRRMIFDSDTCAMVTESWFYFTVVAHGLLCAYVGYHARKTLKLTKTGTTEWCMATVLGGLTVVADLRELLKVHFETSSKKST